MSKKSQLKMAILDMEREIAALELKRERSQSALMRAMLTRTKPNPEDEHYFNVFSSLIDQEREELRNLYNQLADLEKKPEKRSKKDADEEKTAAPAKKPSKKADKADK